MTTTTIDWQPTRDALKSAKGIAWDGCHKIYVLLDDDQMELMAEYGYDDDDEGLVTGKTPEEYLEIIQRWFNASCGLRFINAVKTVPGNPNDGFVDLIAQFEY